MKSTGILFALTTSCLSVNALAYDLVCKTKDPNVSMALVADGADGSLDFLRISAFGVNYGENSIGTPWTQWKSTYAVDDNQIKAIWPMADGNVVQLDLKSQRKQYRGTVSFTKAGSAQTFMMVCK